MTTSVHRWTRVFRVGHALAVFAALFLAGCGGPRAEPEIVYGQRGTQPGDLVRPRAVTIDSQDRVYVVDVTARIQVFDRDGTFLGLCWQTPDHRDDGPSGLSIDRDGNLLVSDTHCYCLRIYSPQGQLLRTISREAGTGPGQLAYIADTVQDEDGNYYLAEYAENNRISKFAPDGRFLKSWGGPGSEPGQFGLLRALAFGPDRLLYAVDCTNHRIQAFTRDGELVRCWGQPGSEPGQLSYPSDLAFNQQGELYVTERGNNRVQKFTKEGESLGCWGGPGREPGRLNEPWAVAVDHHGRVHVIDTENHRVQLIRF
jgi:DNA-binding beta-propeller fold protein YncE